MKTCKHCVRKQNQQMLAIFATLTYQPAEQLLQVRANEVLKMVNIVHTGNYSHVIGSK